MVPDGLYCVIVPFVVVPVDTHTAQPSVDPMMGEVDRVCVGLWATTMPLLRKMFGTNDDPLPPGGTSHEASSRRNLLDPAEPPGSGTRPPLCDDPDAPNTPAHVASSRRYRRLPAVRGGAGTMPAAALGPDATKTDRSGVSDESA